jgi:predicted PurR-regulated permease PerM
MKAILGSLAYILTNLLFILAYIFLLLYYRKHLKEFILRLFPVSQRKEMEFVIDGAGKVSQQYLVGLAKMIGCLWVLYGIGFSICKVPNAIFFAILCGFLEIVPFVGNITGTTITLLVSAMHGAESMTLVGIIIVYGVVQFVQGWLIEPLILGGQVKINPLMTVVVLVIGELVWGIPGIFLAIPLSAMIKTVCDHVEPLKPLGFLLGKADSKQDVKTHKA